MTEQSVRVKGPVAKSDALTIWALDYRLLTEVLVSIADEVAALGVEIKELFVLDAIDEHPHPAAVAEALSLPKPSVTVYLKRLEAAGFVRREIDADDLRRHKLTLTAPGRKVLGRGQTILADAFGQRLARLNADERAEFRRLLEKLG